MKRYSAFVLAVLTASAASVVGQQPAGTPFVLPKGAEPIRLTLRPKSAPAPALKYRLLPELRDVKPGNAAVLYYRAFSPDLQGYRKPEFLKALELWQKDVRKVPPKKVQDSVLPVLNEADLDSYPRADRHSLPVLKEIDLGARRSHVDWELTDRMREEGIALMLPDMQGFRQVATLLAVRARTEAVRGSFDKAAYSLQTGYKISRDIADAPLLITALVGISITGQMLVQTEEIIQLPGSPNLYWALTDLPQPFISMRRAYEGERLWSQTFSSDAQLSAKALNTIAALVGERQLPEVAQTVIVARDYPEARRFLLAQGRSKEAVDAMPMLQVCMIFEEHNLDCFLDDFAKAVTLPFWQANKVMKAAEERLRQAKVNGTIGTTLATIVVPSFRSAQEAPARIDRRIAALRIIEALRLHADVHDGKLPASLDEIKIVPIPIDPMTGNPFQYRLDNDRATLFAPAPEGDTPRVSNVLMYELTMKASSK